MGHYRSEMIDDYLESEEDKIKRLKIEKEKLDHRKSWSSSKNLQDSINRKLDGQMIIPRGIRHLVPHYSDGTNKYIPR